MVRESSRTAKAAVRPKSGAQSLRRALSVLRVVAAGREAGLPLSEVVQATGLTRPTAHRLVNVLVEEGIVEKRARSRRYAIGHQVPELALARPSRSALIVTAEAFLSELSREVGDTAFLTIRTGLDALCVARLIGKYPIQVLSIEVGARRPLGVKQRRGCDPGGIAARRGAADRSPQSSQVRFIPDDGGDSVGSNRGSASHGLRRPSRRAGAGNQSDIRHHQGTGRATAGRGDDRGHSKPAGSAT